MSCSVARNLAAGAAAALFLASFALADIHKLLRAIAYFCGAGAYVAEILILTDGFRRKVPQKELFMAYCFGPLYILLGLELSARSIKNGEAHSFSVIFSAAPAARGSRIRCRARLRQNRPCTTGRQRRASARCSAAAAAASRPGRRPQMRRMLTRFRLSMPMSRSYAS